MWNVKCKWYKKLNSTKKAWERETVAGKQKSASRTLFFVLAYCIKWYTHFSHSDGSIEKSFPILNLINELNFKSFHLSGAVQCTHIFFHYFQHFPLNWFAFDIKCVFFRPFAFNQRLIIIISSCECASASGPVVECESFNAFLYMRLYTLEIQIAIKSVYDWNQSFLKKSVCVQSFIYAYMKL